MKITRETEPIKERCLINLEQDFGNRTEAIAFIVEELKPFDLPDVQRELVNAESPNVWIQFTVNKHFCILSIGLS